jgi:uncharacterized membrane protein SpoIIM required for sporulation
MIGVVRKTVSRRLALSALQSVTVLAMTATATAIMAAGVGAYITSKFAAVAAAFKSNPF